MKASLKDLDYKKFWISRFEKFIQYEVDFTFIEGLLKCAVYDYNFLDRGNYYDVSLRDFILDLSPRVRNRILHIVGGVDHKKLDLVDEERMEEYLEFMLSFRINSDTIFNFLLYTEEEDLLRKLVLKVDCSPFIKKVDIEDQVEVLNLVGPFPQYHPLILELEHHKSLKIRQCVAGLIQKYSIKNSVFLPFNIVDYGVYTMGGSVKGSDNPVAKLVINDPICINKTTELKGEKEMYIGMRFTTSDPKKQLRYAFIQ